MKQQGFILVGVLVMVLIAALVSFFVLEQALGDQRVSRGFLEAAQVDAAAQLALVKGVQCRGESSEQVVVDTSLVGIEASYSCAPIAQDVMLVTAQAGTAENPQQAVWQAYVQNGVEQSRRRLQ